MQAFRILLHALRQLLGNLSQAISMSWLSLGLGTVMTFGLLAASSRAGLVGPGLTKLLAIFGFMFFLAWAAVRWHRFILLDERSKPFAPPQNAVFWRYLKTLAATMLIAVLIITFNFLALIVTSEGGGRALTIVMLVVANVVFSAATLILGTALVGAAVGAPDPIRTAWRNLKTAGGTLLLLSVAGLIGSEALDALSSVIMESDLPGKAFHLFLIVWLFVMFSLSVLTTLWGHYVEGRPLR